MVIFKYFNKISFFETGKLLFLYRLFSIEFGPNRSPICVQSLRFFPLQTFFCYLLMHISAFCIKTTKSFFYSLPSFLWGNLNRQQKIWLEEVPKWVHTLWVCKSVRWTSSMCYWSQYWSGGSIEVFLVGNCCNILSHCRRNRRFALIVANYNYLVPIGKLQLKIPWRLMIWWDWAKLWNKITAYSTGERNWTTCGWGGKLNDLWPREKFV